MLKLSLLLASLSLAAPLPASVKPCRDAAGRIIKCPKPPRTDARCRDANGKFIPCPPASAKAPPKR